MVGFSSQTLLRNYTPPNTNRHFSKLLKFENVKHSPITYTRNELLPMRASVSLKAHMINSINNCTIDMYVVIVSSSHQSPGFAVSVSAVHNDSTVSVVGFEGQSKRWWVS